MLLERLEHSVGIKGIALQWFASYVSRAFVVDPDGLFSHVSPLMQNSFPPKDCEKAAHAFRSSRLNYSNALYSGISQALLSRQQVVQNVSARTKTLEHMF